MIKDLQLRLPPEVALEEVELKKYLSKKLRLSDETPLYFRVLRQSIDARGKHVKVNQQIRVSTTAPLEIPTQHKSSYQNVAQSPAAIVVGSGPAGLFAALRLIELGVKPIVIERGSDVRKRRRDLAAINKDHLVNPESNYCFGEGGAGTYSDGKLYTRSKKRGDIIKSLEMLVAHGATPQILVDSHPHIGTNKLPKVVANLRNTILNYGGEVHFDTKVTDLIVINNEVKGCVDQNGKIYEGIGLILATGHSARDIFELLVHKKIKVESKPFAMGVRIEHPQSFVDACQYNSKDRGLLPAASYSLVTQVDFNGIQKGVFSFCMCPGGFIVPAATDQNELVVNGMSPSRRDSKFANSGVVVNVDDKDWGHLKHHGPLAALELQKEVEHKAWQYAKGNLNQSQKAPAQLITDFWNRKVSKSLKDTSYQPGLSAVDMNELLPNFLLEPLQKGLRVFSKKMKGYEQGQMIGIESRTSSPVRIPRHKDSCEHENVKRLFPCGEGAGYAGGILSAAMDGEKCADNLVKLYKK